MSSEGCFDCGDPFESEQDIVSEDIYRNKFCGSCTELIWKDFEQRRKAKIIAKQLKERPIPRTMHR